MQITFDIADDELQVFMPEAEEQLQKLEEGFMRLEREGADDDLLQVIFRAAHTLKGAAGAIGHQRMARLTHVMETVLDGLRKNQYGTNPAMMDALLAGLDNLRLLLEEVTSQAVSPVDVTGLVAALEASLAGRVGQAGGAGQTSTALDLGSGPGLIVDISIDPNSVASAARALQIMLSLQGLGTIAAQQPTPTEIEAATPVSRFAARLITAKTPAEVEASLGWVADIQVVKISDGQSNGPTGGQAGQQVVDVKAEKPADQPSAPAATGAATKLNGARGGADQTIRTSVERLDALMNLIGELITDRNRLAELRGRVGAKLSADEVFDDFVNTCVHVGRITDQLQEEVMRIRMLPISTAFNKFPRLVRDLAKSTGKQIELNMRGEDTELDRTVIEAISDPLIHLVRNSVDHGIETPEQRRAAGKAETGTVLLGARHEEGRVIIEVCDDGQGIDVAAVKASAVRKGRLSEHEAVMLSDDEAVQLIFESGLSTAKRVSDISGRGVGMDIVRSNIERLNGSVAIETKVGQGTTVIVSLPLTLAIIPALLVHAAETTFAVPLPSVIEALRVPGEQIKKVNGKPVMRLREKVLPIKHLNEILALNGGHYRPNGHEYVVAVRWGKLEMGLVVDRLVGEQELVIKTIGTLIGKTPGTAGAAILGDGRVALIVDVPGLFKLGGA
jgi:two-component system chemotaxis sensor kinase CheA